MYPCHRSAVVELGFKRTPQGIRISRILVATGGKMPALTAAQLATWDETLQPAIYGVCTTFFVLGNISVPMRIWSQWRIHQKTMQEDYCLIAALVWQATVQEVIDLQNTSALIERPQFAGLRRCCHIGHLDRSKKRVRAARLESRNHCN